MIINIIIILIDGFLTNIIPSYFNNINYFYPMLTVTLIPLTYTSNKKKYYKYSFILGIIYDLLYSNIFLYNALIFLLLSKINTKLYKSFPDNLFFKIMVTIINIIIYDTVGYIIIYLSRYQDISIMFLFNKIVKSLLLNILLVFVYYLISKKAKLKHKVKW